MIKTEKGVTEMRAANKPELLSDFSCIVSAVKDKLGENDTMMAFKLGMLSDGEIAEVTEWMRKLTDELMAVIGTPLRGEDYEMD